MKYKHMKYKNKNQPLNFEYTVFQRPPIFNKKVVNVCTQTQQFFFISFL